MKKPLKLLYNKIMFNIYATNSYKNASKFVCETLKHVNQRQINVKRIVLVPDRASMSAEKQMLDTINGSFNTEVLTIRRFANKILPKFNYLSKQAGIMKLTDIIAKNKDKLTCFTKGAESSGFVSGMYETIAQLKYSKVSPNSLDKGDLPNSIKGKVTDIKFLYSEYQEFLQSGYVDSAEKLNILVNEIGKSELVKNSYFYLYDFDNYSAQELAIITELIKHSLGVTVGCCYSENKLHKYLYLNDVYKEMINISSLTGQPKQVFTKEHYESDFEKQIGSYLYTYAKVKPLLIDENKLKIYSCVDVEEEVTMLAQYIREGVYNGKNYGDYFVVTSDVNNYRQAIERTFQDFDIPVFIDTQIKLFDHVFVQYIIDCLNMARNNNKLEYVLDFIKNPFFGGDEDVYLFENYALKYNINYDYSKFDLGKDEIYFEQANNIRKKLYDIISNYKFLERDKISNYIDLIEKFIVNENLDVKLVEFAKIQNNSGLDKYSSATMQVKDKFKVVLDEMRGIFVDSEYKLDDFIKILSAGISNVMISVLPQRNDCVVVANMAKSRKHDIVNLALLGANNMQMPIVKHDTKLLNDNNISKLSEYGINVEPQMQIENKREKFNVFQLLLEPKESLFVSYANNGVEQDGVMQTLTPSDFVLGLSKLFTLDNKNNYPILSSSNVEKVYTKKRSLFNTVRNSRRIIDSQPIFDGNYQILSNKYKDEIKKAIFIKENVDNIDCGEKLFFGKTSISVSKIEEFYSCPYQHFFDYGLKIKPRQVAELNPNDLGSILHETLEKFIRAVKVTDNDKLSGVQAGKFFDIVMQNDYYKGIAKDVTYKHTLLLLKKEAVKMCLLVKKQLKHSHFVNFDAEMQFGLDGAKIKAIEIPVGGQTILLHGIIDRIDTYQNKCIIIDYKSGNRVEYSESLLYMGKKLQLLVYLSAVIKNLGFEPVGFYYFHLHDNFVDSGKEQKAYTYVGRSIDDVNVLKDIDTLLETNGVSERLGIKLKKDGEINTQSKNTLSIEQINAQLTYAVESIKRAGLLMQEGFIKITPFTNVCDYCDYFEICGAKDIYNVNERKLISVNPNDIVEVIK